MVRYFKIIELWAHAESEYGQIEAWPAEVRRDQPDATAAGLMVSSASGSGRSPPPAALAIWGAQLVLNALWSPLFFGLHRPDLALIDIVLLLGLILAFIVVARGRDLPASWLFVPYAL